jgi:hypothetical protein
MKSQWNHQRLSAAEAASLLSDLLRDDMSEPRSLIVSYLDAKRQLAHAFQSLSEELWLDPAPLARVKSQIETAIQTQYPALPAKLKLVRGYGRVHELLFAYLADRTGVEVSADELRILTGDAVHTERRTRDLRDLGLRIDVFDSGGITVYVLRDQIPASGAGAASIVTRNIRDDRNLTARDREDLLASVAAGRLE